MATAEHVIKSRCGRSDTYARTPEGDFLICFGPGTNEDEAAFRAASIAREIRVRLIGDGQDSGTADVSAITTAIELPDGPPKTQDLLTAALNDRLNARLAASETRAREILTSATTTAVCELEPVYGARSSQPVAYYAQLPSDLDQRLQAAYGALPAAERAACDYDRSGARGRGRAGHCYAHQRARTIFVDVSFEVILDRHLEERYLATCRSLDQRLRDRLVLVVNGVPQNCPQFRLFDWVTRIRPLCHGLGFQLEALEAPRFDLMALGSPNLLVTDRSGKVIGREGPGQYRPPGPAPSCWQLTCAGSPNNILRRHATAARARGRPCGMHGRTERCPFGKRGAGCYPSVAFSIGTCMPDAGVAPAGTAACKFCSIEGVEQSLASVGYIPSRQIATAVYLAQHLEKPILVEGPGRRRQDRAGQAVAPASSCR